MNKKDELKLELMSSVDEEIVDRQTDKRFRLLQRPRYSRRRLAGWCSAAACLLLLLSAVLSLLPALSAKQIPVYEGMTVSGSMPRAQADGRTQESIPLMLAAREAEEGARPPFPTVKGADRLLYYARRGEDIYISVHISNPASYEILSFTLNGIKYQSYMFEPGSDSEELILRVNVGEAQGIVSYTIDAIKYIDGTEIKDVKMYGERTVEVGVYPEDPEVHPGVSIADMAVTAEEMRFSTSLLDPEGMFAASNGRLFAYLYAEGAQVAAIELAGSAADAVCFSDLIPGVEYCYCIVAYYDALDGDGFAPHCLYEESFSTKSPVEVTEAGLVGDTTLAFALKITEGQGVTILKTELFNELGMVEATADGEARSFEGLSLGRYTVKVTYSYGAAGERVGYAYSEAPVTVESLGRLADIVKGGAILRGYYTTDRFDATMNDWRPHLGVDLAAPSADEGTVYAAFTGIVKSVSGTGLVLRDASGNTELVYESLTAIPGEIREGSVVVRGQALGTVGDTYAVEVTLDPHVHIEVRVLGEKKDPMDFFIR